MSNNNFKEIRAAIRLVAESATKNHAASLVAEKKVTTAEALIEEIYKEFPYTSPSFMKSIIESCTLVEKAKKEEVDDEDEVVTEDEIEDDDEDFEDDEDGTPKPKKAYYFVQNDDADEEYEFEPADDEDEEEDLKEAYYRIDADALISSQKAKLSKFKYAEDVIDHLEHEAARIAREHVAAGEQVIAPSWLKVVDWAAENYPLRTESLDTEYLADEIATRLHEEIAFLPTNESLTEANASVVYKRGKGAVVGRKVCPPGWKLDGNKCVMQSGLEKVQNKLTGIKIKRAAKVRSAASKQRSAVKSKITKRMVKGRSRSAGSVD